MEIERGGYVKALADRKNNGAIKVITGVRRCGKSYLLFRLYKKYLLSAGVQNEDIIEIPLDDDDFEELRERKNLSQYIKSRTVENRTFYVFLDEVQFCEGFESVLNGLSRKENLDIYVTGSNSRFLSSDILTEFRGRGDEVRVYPLSFAEYLSVYNGEKNDAWREFMLYGGLPRILSCKSDEQKAKYLQDLFKSVYLKDVVERNHLKGDTVLESIVDFLASTVGSLTNATRLSNTFVSNGIMTNDKTVSSYISYLEDAFLIEMAERYDVKGRKYINSARKFYFTDVGLRNARLNFRQQEPSHILENIIYNELLVRGFNVDVGVVEKHIKDSDGKQKNVQLEIDFVCNKGSSRYYIQSAYSVPDEAKMSQETASLDRISDSFKKIIVTQDDIKLWHTQKGYLVINILDFLLDEKSLEL
ncbi:ATP-binding protein [Treponema sp.]|uniref:ATP-binding protein n=1 Tax=Treponema sp. TaxID=166 RepID=UPI003F0BD55F